MTSVPPTAGSLHSYIRNLYLITKSDHKTLLYPEIYFALISALAGPVLTTGTTPSMASIRSNIPKVLLWCYLNVLIIGLSNQRLPSSIMEDKVNKPWRNIPAGRMTSEQYRRFLLVLIPVTLCISWYLDVIVENALLIILTYMYNDLDGADEHFVFRNAFNAGGYFSVLLGVLRIMSGSQVALNRTAYFWIAIISAVVFSTISVQDLKDQKGDKLHGRKSAPLVLGDLLTRWTVALLVLLWSIICLLFFQAEWWTCIGIMAVGLWVAATVLRPENVANDKLAFERWAVWVITLYSLPLTKNIYLLYTQGAFHGLDVVFSLLRRL